MGLFDDPYAAFRQRQADEAQSDMNYANSGGRGFVGVARQAGRQLGRGLFGDPMKEKAMKMQQVQKALIQTGVQPGSPEFFDMGTKLLASAGLPQEAMQLAMQGKKHLMDMEKHDIDRKYKQALIDASRKPSKREMYKAADDYWYWKDNNERVNPRVQRREKNGQEFNFYNNEKLANITSKKASESYGTKKGERAAKRDDMGFEARNQNVQLERVALAMDNGADTGAGAEMFLNMKSLGQTLFGMEFEGMGEQEVIRKVSNEMALRLRNPESGLGLTGNTSNKDLDFLKASVIGLARTESGNRLIIQFMMRQNQMKIDLAMEQERLINENDGAIPTNLDSKLMEYVNNYKFFNDGERDAIDRILKGAKTRTKDKVKDFSSMSDDEILEMITK